MVSTIIGMTDIDALTVVNTGPSRALMSSDDDTGQGTNHQLRGLIAERHLHSFAERLKASRRRLAKICLGATFAALGMLALGKGCAGSCHLQPPLPPSEEASGACTVTDEAGQLTTRFEA